MNEREECSEDMGEGTFISRVKRRGGTRCPTGRAKLKEAAHRATILFQIKRIR
jgi:hypothetical protein